MNSVTTIQFSRRLAVAAGFALPLAETVRRWHQLGDVSTWPFWLDDWAIGGFLLYGAWKTGRDTAEGRPALAAAWGFACGLAYASFFSELVALDQADPSGLPSSIVVALKGMMFMLAIATLVVTLKWRPCDGIVD